MPTPLNDIKIPYPTEGVIRTAALDDTVAPADSVQVAVNMNFDRVGAIQTRPGIEEYADMLVDPVYNFGTLNNVEIPAGFDRIVKLAPTDAFDDSDTTQYYSAAKLDASHIIVFWNNGSSDDFAQVMTVDVDTGALTPVGTPLNFETTNSSWNKCIQIDANHFLNVWSGATNDGIGQVFTVNLTTFAVTAEGSPFTFESGIAQDMSLAQVDADHFLLLWSSTGIGKSQVLKTDLGTWAVTAVGSPFTFDATAATDISTAKVDSSHFVTFYAGGTSHGHAQALAVNLGTYAVTAAGANFVFDSTKGKFNSCSALGDGENFINFWQGASGATGYVQAFNVDPGTFAITAHGTALNFDPAIIVANNCVSGGDGEHFINMWQESTSNAFAVYLQIFDVDQTTFAVTTSSSRTLAGHSNNTNLPHADLVSMSARNVVGLWSTTTTRYGLSSVFRLDADPIFHNYLYAQQGNGNVLNWPNPGWTTRRTGLKTMSKARFTQYLNRIWMVNGNEIIGDAVETSDGGNFDTTLVPAGFPPGDYIQAGFEGRVWVADKINDVVYFTDIVQFTPPDTYTLTYDPATNFIKNFSPQNGQTITALFTTPRALLLFKQDTIYRIYGAFSVDSYPAYNVGTYSQESIVQTKTGLFFHHSSGFYQFNYDSQPVEISRRVIDFIQAIPRDYYPEVKGIYNGFDAVEWHVGPLVVEGVRYESCVMRYTISTQVWTIYDYKGNNITAMISYDDGTKINMIVATTIS